MREYKGGDFDRHSVSAHFGPRRLIDARTEASLLATVDRQWTAGAPETDRFGLRLEGEHRLTTRLACSGVRARRGYNEHLPTVLLIAGGWRPIFASRYMATRHPDRIASSVVATLPMLPGARDTSLWLCREPA